MLLLFPAEECLEDIEVSGPELFVRAEPLVSARERAWVQSTNVCAAADFAPQEPRSFERLDVFRCRRERDFERLRKLAHRFFAFRKIAEHAPARFVSKRMKDQVERGCLLFNHVVEYRCMPVNSQPVG